MNLFLVDRLGKSVRSFQWRLASSSAQISIDERQKKNIRDRKEFFYDDNERRKEAEKNLKKIVIGM